MKRYKLQSELWVPAPLDEVWKFNTHPSNLARITPPFYHLQVPMDVVAEKGTLFTITMSPYGLPMKLRWLSRIEDVQSQGDSRFFVDSQEKGPFAYWRHLHSFEKGSERLRGQRSESEVKVHESGTWIRDDVEYALPFGFLGGLAHRIYIRRSLEEMFSFRVQKLRELF